MSKWHFQMRDHAMAGRLNEYHQKRRFGKSSEPRGSVARKTSRGLRFVVQHHMASRDHYDFRLEWDGVMKSWAVPKGPSYDSHDKRLAVQVEDHPLAYRHFEGIIPRGEYGGGTVMIWDEGNWQPIGDAKEGFSKGSLKFTLEGKRLKGRWALIRMKPRAGEKDHNWLLIKEKDAYEHALDVSGMDTSIRSGLSMSEIGEGNYEKAASMKKTASPIGKKTGKGSVASSLADFSITHPEKVLYPESGITKGDIAAYYRKVAKRMLPYLEKRILSVVRCPGSIGTACFYRKHPDNHHSGTDVVTIPAKSGEEETYFYVDDISGLMYEVQMNTLEFHTWGSRVDRLEKPDVMVFDLDPDEGMDLERIRQGVRDLKGILDALSLDSYLKTSGGKGYHIVVPFKPAAGWDTFYAFAENVAKTMEARWPDRYTSNVRKKQRKNRIFVDWLRNGRGATSIAPYSVRAREGAPVSMPITWKELDTVSPQGVFMADAIARLRRKDPWPDFFDTTRQLR